MCWTVGQTVDVCDSVYPLFNDIVKQCLITEAAQCQVIEDVQYVLYVYLQYMWAKAFACEQMGGESRQRSRKGASMA